MRPSRGRSWLFLGPSGGQVWAGLAQSCPVPSSGAQNLGPGTGQRAPHPQASHLFRLGCWWGPGSPCPRRPPGRPHLPADSCVQWQVAPLSGAPSLQPALEVALWGLRSTRPGPHIWQSPKRAGHSQDRSALLRRARVGWAGGGVQGTGLAEGGSGLGAGPQVWRRRTLSSGWPSVRLF